MAMSPDDPSFLERLKGVLSSPNTGNLGAALLANSGYSNIPRSFGQIAGTSYLQSQQIAAERQNEDIRRRYMEAQIAALSRKPASSAFGDINPSQYTPESIAAFQKSVNAGAPDYSALAYNQKTADTPSNIREYEYYTKLQPAEQQKYLEMKRSLNPFSMAELAGGKGAFDKRSGTFRSMTTAEQEAAGESQIAGAKAGASKTAEKTSEAAFDLPRVERTVQQALGDIEKLKAHPGLQYITGLSSKVPVIPGTSQAAAQALADQIRGQTFLQAYQSLKGGGAITEIEGTKAEGAIARLNQAQSTKDYKAALDDLEAVLQKGLAQAQKQAGAKSASAQIRKTVGGKTYVKVDGQWYEDDGT